ncbi:hypothetical protein [Methanosarcina sp. UBA5]|uniref:hypothetical protein n=1 Tax=Methanosarcina sp. UBA5 TaxID=1915593 RepID=UPI0025EABFB8|nr:hypothetical protein [Methanosarcina sp. UBA5]
MLENSYCASDVTSLTDKDQTTVSKHLKVRTESLDATENMINENTDVTGAF